MNASIVLRKWLAAGETERVIESLQDIANRSGDKYLLTDVTHQSSRFYSLAKDREKGVISDEFYTRQLNGIRQALQSLIDRVPAGEVIEAPEPNLPASGPPTLVSQPLGDSGNAPSAKKENDQDVIKPTVSPHIPWIVGLALLVFTTILAVAIECPSGFIATTTQFLLALGTAGVATLLPGLLSIDVKGVKAGSAIGIFVLVLATNPAKMMRDDSGCNKIPFEFTISLQTDKALNLPPRYPKLEAAVLQIRLDNKWEDATMDANGDGDYKSIPGDFKDKKVAARLNSKYWKLVQDSVVLSGKSGVLSIVPNGVLGLVTGKLRTLDGSRPVPDATLEIEGVLDTTDDRGNFSLPIPIAKQQTEYQIEVQKKGYATKTETITFDGSAIELRLKKQ